MSLHRQLHRLLLVLSLLSLLAYAASGPDGTTLALLVIPLTIGAWWVTGADPERAAPRYAVNLLLALICAYTVVRAMELSISVRVFADFVTLLIPVKMLDRRRPRDAAQVISLVIFLLIGSILTDNTFETAMLMLVFIPFCAYTMMVFQLWLSEDAGRAARAEPVRSTPGLRRGLRGLTALGLVIGLPITASAFILMPRNSSADAAQAWGGAGTGQVTGFNDEIQLGRSGLISSSPEPVLDLELRSASGERLGGEGQTYYLRGAVLENYDPETGRWSADRGPRGDTVTRQATDRGDRGFAPLGRRPAEWDTEQTVTLRDSSSRATHLFAVWRPKQIRIGQRYAIDPQTRELRAGDASGSFTYEIRSLRNDRDARSPDERVEVAADERPEIEFDMPEARALAVSIIERLDISPDPGERSWADDAAAAAALENSFTRRNYAYSIDQIAPPPGREPIVWFLRESRTGHCEYFASGMAAMCRSIGIDARVVTGYIATDFVPGSKHYVVRASNAHAWVEVQVGLDAWRRYDPSPSADLQRLHQSSQTLLAQLRDFYESVEYGWIRAVIGFDEERRDTLLGAEMAESSENLLGGLARRPGRGGTPGNAPARRRPRHDRVPRGRGARLLNGDRDPSVPADPVGGWAFAARRVWRHRGASGRSPRGRDRPCPAPAGHAPSDPSPAADPPARPSRLAGRARNRANLGRRRPPSRPGPIRASVSRHRRGGSVPARRSRSRRGHAFCLKGHPHRGLPLQTAPARGTAPRGADPPIAKPALQDRPTPGRRDYEPRPHPGADPCPRAAQEPIVGVTA